MIDLNELLELAANEAAGAQAPTYSAIAKELLHYEIMLAISRSEVAPRIAFQGGTALRLCYGGQRYSEDLVFVCGSDAKEPFRIDDVERLLHIILMRRRLKPSGHHIGTRLLGKNAEFRFSPDTTTQFSRRC
jgi:predicted nucleotidyltransferase component of viral defense system